MFHYTTQTVINNEYALDVFGKPKLDHLGVEVPRFAGTTDAFTVTGTGTYKKGNIEAVYKRAFTAGEREVAKITVLPKDAGTILRLTVVVKLQENTQSDYVNFSYDFKQPLTVEVTATGTVANDATALAKTLNKMKVEYGRSLFVASASGADLTLTVRYPEQHFESIVLEEVTPDAFAPIITSIATGEVTTPGHIGFGDDAWMLRAVELPSYENSRHFRPMKDEKPILGGKYSQYTLKYKVEIGEGMGVWGASNVSITNHVFWVKSDLVDAFEDAITDPNGLNVSIKEIEG